MEVAEVTRMSNANEQYACAERANVRYRSRIESTDLRDEQIPSHGVEESPYYIDR
jgi:hypothetical protein